MKTYSFSHKINANSKSVIQTMYDIENYNTWNNCIRYRTGKMKVGEELILEASLDGQKFIKWPCKVEQLNADSFILSKSILAKPYMYIQHKFKVTPINEASCEVVHTWNASGISPYFFWKKITPVLDKFKAYNESLKAYTENKKNSKT